MARALGPAQAAAELARRRRNNPLSYMRWLPIQDRYRRSQRRFRLLRAGNQELGKTTGALGDLVEDALGEHPFRPCPEHGEYWVICASWSQSVAIQRKLYALLPKDRIKPGTVFTELRGFRGKNPAVEIRHRDGGWSIIRFKTTRQGSLQLASATIRGALFDEPPTSQSIYAEVCKRVTETGGWVSISMTPIGAPCEWIRELAEKDGIEDIHSRLTVEALRFVGSAEQRRKADGTVCDQAYIDQVIRETPSAEVDIRVHGEFESRSRGRYFTVFDSSAGGAHVRTELPSGKVRILLGIDHGHRPGKQCALLMAVVQPTQDADPVIYILDEYIATTGLETPKEDARGILDMLRRNGMSWTSVDWVCGDRVHLPGTGQQKSSKDLAAQIAKMLKVPADALRPPVRTTNKRTDSVAIGCRWLFHAMARPGHFIVNPRCVRTIRALDNYLGPKSPDDEHHDPIDGMRYGLQEHIFGTVWRSATRPTRIG